MVNRGNKQQIAAYIEKKQTLPKRQAAIQAGYSETTALRPSQIESSQTYQEILATYVPKNKLLKTLTDGLDAVKVTRSYTDGKVTEYEDIDYVNRHKFMETGMKLHGMFEIDNSQKAAKFALIVNPSKKTESSESKAESTSSTVGIS